jgi:hypothetical protein
MKFCASSSSRAFAARFASLAIVGATILSAATATAFMAPPKTKMDTPTISCAASSSTWIEIQVCAGATGAPAGFSVQWMLKSEFDANGGWPISSDVVEGSSFCKASFSGNANGSIYNLGPNACTTVQIGDNLYDNPGASSPCSNVPLLCGEEYVFRAFAHATSTLMRSNFTATRTCETLECTGTGEGGCTYTQGYWKTHGPIPTGNNSNEWPVTSLTLGNVSYTDLELQAIFDTPAGGNGLISLAHQLIAAKLNVASGADATSIQATIDAADTLIGDRVVPPVGSGSLAPSATSSLTTTLDSFNTGLTGPGHCE